MRRSGGGEEAKRTAGLGGVTEKLTHTHLSSPPLLAHVHFYPYRKKKTGGGTWRGKAAVWSRGRATWVKKKNEACGYKESAYWRRAGKGERYETVYKQGWEKAEEVEKYVLGQDKKKKKKKGRLGVWYYVGLGRKGGRGGGYACKVRGCWRRKTEGKQGILT